MDKGTRTDPPVFDIEGVSRRLMHDDTLILMVLQAFILDMPTQIKELGALFRASDLSGMRHQAHSIKGACANVGALVLHSSVFEAEMAAREGEYGKLAILLDEIEVVQHTTYAEMREIIETLQE